MAHAIEAEGLVKNYPGDVRALDGLSVTIGRGEILGLLGPNGAGKSTTVKILTTLIRPDAGAATVAGHDVLRRPDRVRRVIGVVSQRSGADPEASGRDNLVLQGRLYGMGGARVRSRAAELLARFGLEDAAGRPVKTYSGGMRRRLDVALGLVHRPQVLFLDEPTTGLDPEARASMWAEIARLAGDDALAILLTTHYLEEADRLARRLAIVDRGRVVVEGTPDSLKGELRGDAVHVEWREAPPEPPVREALGRLPGVREIVLDGPRLSARADDGASAVPAVLAALDQAGVPASAATVARPSLDDVYLRYAGRRFARADAPDHAETAAAGGAR
ncbi:ATP-binding cassette domain-containing protein [Actinomadura citrea]|uniref:ABC-2 type transport system ATP-binding protein n=1 Tax=Actinomadura citrea TaxID=46158 RepID=A0A7Y9KDI8_9ACTN|nr:ATP-binding cassette domain-containing protein [Actinomadura citrea]NYE13386.1 ABC-2 type transport system ATP-binding protein [Actinomadura citrea]GGT85687.1 daunorubicin resistance protein DrrA family ABC transporter ATP-binding protein [Actinomadura citrea]